MKRLSKKVAKHFKERLNEWRTARFGGGTQRAKMFELPLKDAALDKHPHLAMNFAVTPPPLNAGELARRRQNGDL